MAIRRIPDGSPGARPNGVPPGFCLNFEVLSVYFSSGNKNPSRPWRDKKLVLGT